MRRSFLSFVEPLECRIAPAAVVNTLPNIVAGVGKTSATVDLGTIFDSVHSVHTFVTFHTNFDSDPNTPGIQGDITIELYDDVAPLTVQNFLSYATNTKAGAGYLGTFFQRLVTLGGTGSQNYILQGGGFDAANFQHIATHTQVPDEVNPANSNLTGTVAMAKGTDPNTASSDFFFNLNDNSGLDNPLNSGGFTVFGKLTSSSLAVVQAFEQQDLQPGGVVSLTPGLPYNNVPVQGGYSTASGHPPTPSQLLTITGVDVQAPTGDTPDGISYTVGVANPATSPKLVTFTQTGDVLNLKYLKGAAGVSTVTVTAHDSHGGADVVQSFQVSVLPDLLVSSMDMASPILTDGDTGQTSVKITNVGGGVAKGKVDVFYYLSRVTTSADSVNDDPNGNLLNDIGGQGHEDRLIGTLSNVSLNLASGASVTLSSKYTTPDELKTAFELGRADQSNPSTTDPVTYRIIAEVLPHTGTSLPEIYTTDNSGAGQVGHNLANVVGSFSGGGVSRTNVPIHYVDENGNQVTMTLKGGGFGVLTVDSAGHAGLDLVKTTGKSTLAAAVTAGPGANGGLADGGHTPLTYLFVDQPPSGDVNASLVAMGTIAFGPVDLSNDFSAVGGLKSLTLGNLAPLTGDTATHNIDLGNFSEAVGQKAAITLGSVTNYNLTANEAISTLKAKEWLDTNSSTETVLSRYLDSLSIQGDFEADLSVRGAVTVKSINIGGLLRGSEVHIGGNVGNVTIGAMDTSDFLVGVESVPSSRASFDAIRTIASFILKGTTSTTSTLSNSNIVAAGIANLSVGRVDTNASGTGVFGVEAEQILHYQRITTGAPLKLNNLDTPGATPDVQGRYVVALI